MPDKPMQPLFRGASITKTVGLTNFIERDLRALTHIDSENYKAYKLKAMKRLANRHTMQHNVKFCLCNLI